MKKKNILAAVGVSCALGLTAPSAHARQDAAPAPCAGSLESHQGDCKVVTYRYRDGFVPTGEFDPASFPQTLAADTPACGWQRDLLQADAETPETLTEPGYFDQHGWLVDSAQSPAGTPACIVEVTTTTTTSTTEPQATTTTIVPPTVAPPADVVPAQPTFAG
jgi:hypothetical protein